MKKKILSIALVLGILLSLLSSIPVSAADASYTRSLPYAFFDYEDGVNNLQEASIVDDGMAGSGKCLKYTSTADGVNHDDKGIYLGGNSEAVVGDVPANNTFKISFYVKVTQQLTKGNLVLFINYKNKNNVSGSASPLKTFDPTKVNEWQKVEFEHSTTEDITITSLRMRYGGHGAHLENGNFVVGESTSVARTYYFDDMEMTVTSPFQSIPGSGGGSTGGATTPSVPVNMTLADYTMDFENGSSIHNVGGQNATTTPSTTNGQTIQLVSDPAGGSNTVLKVDLPSSDVGDTVGLGFSVSTTSTTRASAIVPAGGKITYTFKYYIPEAVKSSPTNLRTHPAFIISHYPGSAFASLTAPLETAEQQWHTATLEYTNTGSSAKEMGGYQLRFNGAYTHSSPAQTTWILANHTGSGYGDRTFYFDDFRVTVTDPSAPPPAEEAELSLDNYSMDFESDATIQVNGSNITDTEAGTATELAKVAEDPANSNNKAMKLTLAPAAVGTASTMKFSGKAGAGTDKVTAPGTIPAGGKIIYKFKYYLANEVDDTVAPAFRVKHATGSAIATQAAAFATTANQWHEAKLTYINNANTDLAIDGATLLYSGDDANAKQWKAADGSALVIYFDDFTVETKEPSFPTSSDLRFNGKFEEGEEITFYHTFTPSETGAEDASIVRFLATVDGLTGSLGSCKIGDTFTVPKAPKGATLSFEVVPVDSGILGVKIPYTYASVVGQDAKLTLSGFAADGSVTAEVVIENKRFDNSDIRALLIVVMLNDKGGIVKYGKKAIVCTNGTTVSGTAGKLILPTDNADPALSKAVKAAAYLWYCEGNEEPSFANTTMVEIVEDEFVVKAQN